MTPYKAIREKCLDCCCYSADEVRKCIDKGCALWPHRMGCRPETAVMIEADKIFQQKKTKSMTAFQQARQKARTASLTRE